MRKRSTIPYCWLVPLLLALVANASARIDHLMPKPATVEWGVGGLPIDASFRVGITGVGDPLLYAAARRALRDLSLRTGVPIVDSVSTDRGATLVLECSASAEPVQSLHTDESYDLEASSTQVTVRSATPVGIVRGLSTLMQLIERDGQGFVVPAVHIHDRPRFLWRGLMIDVSRRWIPAAIIRRNLDAMAAVKLNVFHWHLTDDQGFRIESRVFPRLHEMGSDNNYYTQQEVREIVVYARNRGIRIVPEFDMPGHTGSWFPGYPQLASTPGPFVMDRELEIRDAAMDPTREEVYEFLDKFIGEMALLFPDEYFHIGGDEVNGKQWAANPKIQAFMRAHDIRDHHDLQVYFNQRLLRILQKHGKKMIGWDEVLHPQLPKDIVVQSWRGQSSLAEAATHGYMGILSTGYYLDMMEHASASYGVDPLSAETASLSPEQQSKILGGEACLWTENIDLQNADSAIWPRTAAIAERLWSPANVTDVDSMYRRLEDVSRQLEWLGLTHRQSSHMMLERLAGDANPTPLLLLDRVLEPLNCDLRRKVHRYTFLTPLNRLVDATPPESDTAREFVALATQWQPNVNEIRNRLILWRKNQGQVVPLLQSSALLQEDMSLAEDVAAVASAGLEALDYLEKNQQAPERWIARQRVLLQAAEKPRAELLIAIVPGVAKLIDAAAATH